MLDPDDMAKIIDLVTEASGIFLRKMQGEDHGHTITPEGEKVCVYGVGVPAHGVAFRQFLFADHPGWIMLKLQLPADEMTPIEPMGESEVDWIDPKMLEEWFNAPEVGS